MDCRTTTEHPRNCQNGEWGVKIRGIELRINGTEVLSVCEPSGGKAAAASGRGWSQEELEGV